MELAKQSLTFNNLILECKSGRTRTKKTIDELVSEDLVEITIETCRGGKSKRFSLTPKGKIELSKNAVEQFNKCFKELDFIDSNIFSNPLLLNEFRNHLRTSNDKQYAYPPIVREDTPRKKEEIDKALKNFSQALMLVNVTLYTGNSEDVCTGEADIIEEDEY